MGGRDTGPRALQEPGRKTECLGYDGPGPRRGVSFSSDLMGKPGHQEGGQSNHPRRRSAKGAATVTSGLLD